MKHVLVGFGFGPIQAGLFAAEARASGNFSDIVVAEVDQALVDAVRRNGDKYAVNVAHKHGLDVIKVEGVTLLNPRVTADHAQLLEALSRATEIVTCLPSVMNYSSRGADSVSGLIAEGLQSNGLAGTIVYAAENNNRAAEILQERMTAEPAYERRRRPAQFLNTVIGKMSQVVSCPGVTEQGLTPIAPGLTRAFLVEDFNSIMTEKVRLPGVQPGIKVFEQKDDILPFEEAKLFGHNAVHAMLGFLGKGQGVAHMAELAGRRDIMERVRTAFINEIGRALIAKYGSFGDQLFTPGGFERYADDLLARMTNPFLADTVERAIRDPVRKLGYSDRIFGAIRLCLGQGIDPVNLAAGAWAGLEVLLADATKYNLPAGLIRRTGVKLNRDDMRAILAWLWHDSYQEEDINRIIEFI